MPDTAAGLAAERPSPVEEVSVGGAAPAEGEEGGPPSPAADDPGRVHICATAGQHASLRSWCQLEDDPTEHVDLSPRHADLAYELVAELAKLNATLFEPVRGTPSLEACLRGIDEGQRDV